MDHLHVMIWPPKNMSERELCLLNRWLPATNWLHWILYVGVRVKRIETPHAWLCVGLFHKIHRKMQWCLWLEHDEMWKSRKRVTRKHSFCVYWVFVPNTVSRYWEQKKDWVDSGQSFSWQLERQQNKPQPDLAWEKAWSMQMKQMK